MASFQPHYSSYQPHDSLFADQRLEQRVRTFLITHAQLQRDEVSISVTAGRVTLRGTTSSASRKQLIEHCCYRVAGVQHVINELAWQASEHTVAPVAHVPARRFRRDLEHTSADQRREASWSLAIH